MIAQDLCDNALVLIGKATDFEEPSTGDRSRAFKHMKSMLSRWRIKRLTIDHDVRWQFTLTALTAAFTIGPTGDWVMARPNFIRAAMLVDANGVETPLVILTDDQYAALPNKSETAVQPCAILHQRVVPLGRVFPWPIQTVEGTIALYIPTPLAEMAALATPIDLADGWQEAIEWNLALRLCTQFSKPVTQELVDNARSSLADIKSINSAPPRISTEGYIQTCRR